MNYIILCFLLFFSESLYLSVFSQYSTFLVKNVSNFSKKILYSNFSSVSKNKKNLIRSSFKYLEFRTILIFFTKT